MRCTMGAHGRPTRHGAFYATISLPGLVYKTRGGKGLNVWFGLVWNRTQGPLTRAYSSKSPRAQESAKAKRRDSVVTVAGAGVGGRGEGGENR